MNIKQLHLEKEIIPLFDARINYKVSQLLHSFIIKKCDREEINRRQSILQSLLICKRELINYQYNAIYFGEAVKLKEALKLKEFLFHKNYLLFEKVVPNLDKITSLKASFIFFGELYHLLNQFKVKNFHFEKLLVPIINVLEEIITYRQDLKTNKGILQCIQFLESVDFDCFWNDLFQVECYISIAKCTIKRNYTLPVLTEKQFILDEVFHPNIKNPKKYSVDFNQALNILTGPNMGGKSTFLRTVSICTFLGCKGLPIPGKKSQIPFFQYLSVNLNTDDDYSKGTSHYMNEVLSLKEFLERKEDNVQVYGVFDEIFNTTNPQEALKIITYVYNNLKLSKGSFLMISTHLDVHKLKHKKEVGFYYPKVSLENNEVKFSYSIEEGISDLKLGEKIFNQSGILDLL